jgi:hypothetical protein
MLERKFSHADFFGKIPKKSIFLKNDGDKKRLFIYLALRIVNRAT